jgi:APA family basic amino acid/polyamine antiporter
MSLLLVSIASAMTIAGPRVLQVIGEDFRRCDSSGTNSDGILSTAIYFQSTLTIIFVLTSSFESILVFAGFTLALNSFATVLGVFVLRHRQPELPRPYRTFLYPLTPLLYLALTGWTLTFVLLNKPTEGMFGLAIIAAGLVFYFVSEKRNRAR